MLVSSVLEDSALEGETETKEDVEDVEDAEDMADMSRLTGSELLVLVLSVEVSDLLDLLLNGPLKDSVS